MQGGEERTMMMRNEIGKEGSSSGRRKKNRSAKKIVARGEKRRSRALMVMEIEEKEACKEKIVARGEKRRSRALMVMQIEEKEACKEKMLRDESNYGFRIEDLEQFRVRYGSKLFGDDFLLIPEMKKRAFFFTTTRRYVNMTSISLSSSMLPERIDDAATALAFFNAKFFYRPFFRLEKVLEHQITHIDSTIWKHVNFMAIRFGGYSAALFFAEISGSGAVTFCCTLDENTCVGGCQFCGYEIRHPKDGGFLHGCTPSQTQGKC